MTLIDKRTTLTELAFIVSQELIDSDINAVLTGGAVVSVYTKNQYESSDLDFVTDVDMKKVEQALSKIGFIKKAGKHFIHPSSKYFVEFLFPPLAVGDERINKPEIISKDNKKLILLPPTYSVMDRLAAYFYWDDKQGLDQAVMVAKKQIIDLNKIKKWAIKEDQKEKFNNFLKRL